MENNNRSIIYDDILQFWYSEYIDNLPESATSGNFPKSFFRKLVLFLKIIVRDTFRIFLPSSINGNNDVWLFVSSINNYNSISFLNDEINSSKYVKPRTGISADRNVPGEQLIYRWKIIYTLKGLYFFFIFLRYSNRKQYASKHWPYFFNTLGLFEESVRYLKKYNPKAIIFSNDHSVEQRALLLAAKECGIKTIYIQHASVTKYFPPLKFDLSLLEGQDAYDKYKSIGSIEGKVELVGMPKFDEYVEYRSDKDTIDRIGVCFNMTDRIGDVEKTTKFLVQEFPDIEFYLRPHPRESRNFYVNGVKLSDSKKTNAFQFLKNVDAIIAGNTSIHLEAAIFNVLPIYYSFSNKGNADSYGYTENGLTVHAKSKEEIIGIIEKYKSGRPEVYRKAKYYNSAIDTSNEGKIKILVADILKGYLK
ncbi:MAG: hypothetical protein CL666_13985 [Balneola sp.]|nr:hypothetical protein [Balneola sp.]|tara:strand:- start:46696 stop:47955 length:1260 start_codon:yes stop_codon:yes gene_type:complete